MRSDLRPANADYPMYTQSRIWTGNYLFNSRKAGGGGGDGGGRRGVGRNRLVVGLGRGESPTRVIREEAEGPLSVPTPILVHVLASLESAHVPNVFSAVATRLPPRRPFAFRAFHPARAAYLEDHRQVYFQVDSHLRASLSPDRVEHGACAPGRKFCSALVSQTSSGINDRVEKFTHD
jgi:hypothetical protein